jgi:predicted metallo-beta-lactamase superfamily hydrolase
LDFLKNYKKGGFEMQEEEIEISQKELLEIIKRLGSEIVELRYELKTTKQEIERLQRLINLLTDYAIKKSIQK